MKIWPFGKESPTTSPPPEKSADAIDSQPAVTVAQASATTFEGRYPATRRTPPPNAKTELASQLVSAADAAREEAKAAIRSRADSLCGELRAAGEAFGAQLAEEEVAVARSDQRAAEAAAEAERREQTKDRHDDRAASSADSGISPTVSAIALADSDSVEIDQVAGKNPARQFFDSLTPLDLQVHQDQARRTAFETLESVREAAEASLVDHELSLRELIPVLETGVQDEATGKEEAESRLIEAQTALEIDQTRPYEQQDQMLQHVAWAAEYSRDDHAYNLRTQREYLVRSHECLQSIERLRMGLPDRVKEHAEEAAEGFSNGALTAMINRRSELLAEGPKADEPEIPVWKRIGRGATIALAVLGALSVIVAGVWVVRYEIAKKPVPDLTGRSVKSAVAAAEKSGLRPTVVGAAPASAAQKVCAQEPMAGEKSRVVRLLAGEACVSPVGSQSGVGGGASRAR